MKGVTMNLPRYYEFCGRVKIKSGMKALEEIPSSLGALNAKRPMIITDKGVSGAGLITLVANALKNSNPKITIGEIVDDVPADSDISLVNGIAAKYRKKKCDSIIAVGGGSPIDTAKGVNVLVSLGGDDLADYEGAGKVKEELKPLIVIPTTAGTGSEVTQAAVIADHSRNMKISFTSYFMLPNIAVLDPRMTKTLPDFLTASTGMDAMTHACEAYIGMAKNPLSDAAALGAIELISQNLLKVIKKPGDLKGRLALANGSTMAGMAFSNSMVGLVHNLGHATGGVCGVPHGVCMSILLPYGMEYNLHKVGKEVGELLFPLAGSEVYGETAPTLRPARVIEYLRQMNFDLRKATRGRHATSLKEIVDINGELLVPRTALPDIARTAMSDGSKVYNTEEISFNDGMMVLEHAWEGIPLDLSRIKKGKKKHRF